eukprot:TRINITY_DN88_c0_g1_i1.p2 TRINITY_DN88_c0_g1~~TRINITY_DN88_c0_g1_i1.p2  ORF type:complete len:428 (-),score=122.24 TRINITY_DN88_c0_g1_i1:257-1540(-)
MSNHSTVDSMEETLSTEDLPMAVVAGQQGIVSEESDRKQFTQEIHKFMSEIGKPLSKIPIMGYKELDLYQLYKEVIAHGGFNEVVKNVGTWSKIWKRLGNFDPSITDSSFRLKKNYERYLLEYEFKCFPEHRLQAMEYDSNKSSMKRSGSQNNLQRPHSPTQLGSTTSSASGYYHSSSNPSSGPSSPHHSPDTPRKAQNKDKKGKKAGKTPRKGPSRSSSFNSLYLPPTLSSVRLPLVLGDLTVESLGTVVPRYPYVVDGQIWPVGYVSHRMFNSRLNQGKQVRYTSQIIDAGERPQFIVTASDDPTHPIISNESPSACWRAILQHFMDNNDDHTSISSTDKLSVSGRLRFGLTVPEVASLIRELPHAEKAFELFGSMSPSKRKYQSDDSSDEIRMKVQRSSALSSNDDDLESAIATLQALKYSSGY